MCACHGIPHAAGPAAWPKLNAAHFLDSPPGKSAIVGCIRDNSVLVGNEVQVRHAEVGAAAAAALTGMRALEPDTMSWGNLCDYTQPQAFHHLARAASMPRTRHFLYSLTGSSR